MSECKHEYEMECAYCGHLVVDKVDRDAEISRARAEGIAEGERRFAKLVNVIDTAPWRRLNDDDCSPVVLSHAAWRRLLDAREGCEGTPVSATVISAPAPETPAPAARSEETCPRCHITSPRECPICDAPLGPAPSPDPEKEALRARVERYEAALREARRKVAFGLGKAAALAALDATLEGSDK